MLMNNCKFHICSVEVILIFFYLGRLSNEVNLECYTYLGCKKLKKGIFRKPALSAIGSVSIALIIYLIIEFIKQEKMLFYVFFSIKNRKISINSENLTKM